MLIERKSENFVKEIDFQTEIICEIVILFLFIFLQPVLIATGEKAIDPGESDITMVSLQSVQLRSK